ncbi:Beta-hexosaminidase subunit alpha/beta [Penicillium subrubescens]|uniref:beta-N-acetylhexosaminidase n=1 Tax=Penicillium subrubescens TaxID=1316194 RepID=A0A1Q5UGL2_9EURO|nr:Beta-hexosaminidase subunit alpha/beta [Penicillium subrubescens]KAJ5875748.1 Beta-hexosaminidase subunit alpha/beta [Penicillium subrubescens]OKP11627.1 Beta-N-acetylhexosaminidase [Penicillium subrubescens]
MNLSILALAAVASALQILPPIEWDQQDSYSDAKRGFSLKKADHIIYLQDDLAHWRDQNGLTLIPPSGLEFARTLRKDLEEITNSSWQIRTVKEPPKQALGVFLSRSKTPSDFTYEDGTVTEEGYELIVEHNRVSIQGSGARGMWWGTRTLLQQLMLSPHATIPAGRVKDAPAYATRGFMLDAGRKWYSLDYLKDLCTYASFFKLSEFHYHATDNYPLSRGPNVAWNEVHSQFSLRPDNPDLLPLVQRENETLSRADFDDFQSHCAARGVTVIPEIESPGHCLSITKWRPDLALKSRDLLNISHPDTVPLVKSIWSEFLPWFHTKEVHIGADEYDLTLANDYIAFVNEMSQFVRETSGKLIRIWGTYEPSEMLSIDKNITIQHWQYGQSDPVQLARDGYQVINSEDWWAYMSLKNNHVPISPAPYPQFFNNARVLNFADKEGWQWTPQLFNPVNITEQPEQKAVRGAILAAWNDNGPDATTQLESYYAIRNGIPVVASRTWTGSRGPRLDEAGLEDAIEILTSNAVGENLDRKISRKKNTRDPLISWNKPRTNNARDQITLGYGSKGMNYTLQLSVEGPFSLESNDTILSLSETGQLTFTADGWPYPLLSVAEGDGFHSDAIGRIWANATSSTHEVVQVPQKCEITITSDTFTGSRVWVNDQFVGRFEVFVYGGKNRVFSWSQMAFVAPLEVLRGTGLERIVLY